MTPDLRSYNGRRRQPPTQQRPQPQSVAAEPRYELLQSSYRDASRISKLMLMAQ